MMANRNLQAETHVHDMSPFHFLAKLKAAGLGNYPSRAMVCVGTTVTGADSAACVSDLMENFRHLRRVDIGTDDLIIVNGNNVMLGLLEDENTLGRVRASIIDKLRPLRLYLSRNMDPLVRRLGLSMDDILTPDWSLAERFDDKLKIRNLGQALGCEGFSPWRYLLNRDRSGIDTIRAEVLAEADVILPTDVVFLKRPDYDGGEGILRWNPDTPRAKVESFLDEHLAYGLLMEAGYPADRFDMKEASVQVEITEHEWEPLYPSLQITRDNAHSGNELLLGEHLIEPDVWKRMLEIMRPICKYAVEKGYGRNRPRRMGFDFLNVRGIDRWHVFNNEINARDTAPQYAYAVAQQIAPRFGNRAAVLMENMQVTRFRDHEALECALADLLWKGGDGSGVLIGNAGCISHGKVTVYAIGKTLEEARATRDRLPPL